VPGWYQAASSNSGHSPKSSRCSGIRLTETTPIVRDECFAPKVLSGIFCKGSIPG
jgi:hypothetical protein